MWPRVALLEHRLVEARTTGRGARPCRLARDLEHHALGSTSYSPATKRSSAAVELRRLDLGEVAELTHVDAEHRHAGLVDEVDGAEHGAVAAHEITTSRSGRRRASVPPSRVGQCAPRCRRPASRAVRGVRDQSSAAVRALGAADPIAAGGACPVTAPRRRAAPRRRGDSSSSAGPAEPCTRNSTLPSAPVSGDAITSTTWRPGARRPSRPRAAPRGCTAGIADDALPLPTSRPAGLELRLDEQHQIGARAACSASSAGATVRSEMNERSATARSTGPPRSSGVEVADVGALPHVDPRVVARRRSCSWPWPTSTATTVRGAALQQAVGEPTGRGAGVEGTAVPARRASKRSSAASSFSPPRRRSAAGRP